uniref:Uncharacterized protein n=2 Tax=Physcomitrium patens TaxID=3218 RepID=A9RRS2_PHYPA|nr:hypothetical protein PHYPA_012438 [Physcomitrium patens]
MEACKLREAKRSRRSERRRRRRRRRRRGMRLHHQEWKGIGRCAGILGPMQQKQQQQNPQSFESRDPECLGQKRDGGKGCDMGHEAIREQWRGMLLKGDNDDQMNGGPPGVE